MRKYVCFCSPQYCLLILLMANLLVLMCYANCCVYDIYIWKCAYWCWYYMSTEVRHFLVSTSVYCTDKSTPANIGLRMLATVTYAIQDFKLWGLDKLLRIWRADQARQMRMSSAAYLLRAAIKIWRRRFCLALGSVSFCLHIFGRFALMCESHCFLSVRMKFPSL